MLAWLFEQVYDNFFESVCSVSIYSLFRVWNLSLGLILDMHMLFSDRGRFVLALIAERSVIFNRSLRFDAMSSSVY